MELTRKQFVISILPSVLIMIATFLMLFGSIINHDKSTLTGGSAISLIVSFIVGGIVPISLIRRRNIDVSKAVIWLTIAAVVGFALIAVPFWFFSYAFFSYSLFVFIPILELIGFIILIKKLACNRQQYLVLALSNPLVHFLMCVVLIMLVDVPLLWRR